MTNAKRKERRREAALKAARTCAAKQATTPAKPQAPTAREIHARALGIRRERDIYRRVHELRASHRPADWSPRVRLALDAPLTLWEAKR